MRSLSSAAASHDNIPSFLKTDVFKCSRCLSLCLNVIMSDSVDSSVCCQRQWQQVVCVFAASLVESVGLSSFSISQSYYWSHSLLGCVLYLWCDSQTAVSTKETLSAALFKGFFFSRWWNRIWYFYLRLLVGSPHRVTAASSTGCDSEREERATTHLTASLHSAGCVHRYFTSVCRVSHLESEVRVDPCQQDVTWYHRLWRSRTHLAQLISIYGSVLLFLCTFWICTSQNFTRSSSRNRRNK